jgi:hypothetical protein
MAGRNGISNIGEQCMEMLSHPELAPAIMVAYGMSPLIVYIQVRSTIRNIYNLLHFTNSPVKKGCNGVYLHPDLGRPPVRPNRALLETHHIHVNVRTEHSMEFFASADRHSATADASL